ncbi:MAG: tRNA guanosine(34) transglycosylase Tgt [Alphaproteobacteria bacterium]|nr:tRNA guanosine(34) transglycosylase Tgt [Alphaproteobacteria bacterium]PHY01697.1 MAG: tRNA guanosine(34) transglycosylase Tgt [Rhodospirillaceae bacterium]
MSAARFELMASEGAARRGRLHTAHGVVDTPAFMPVGTAATVKAMFTDTVAATGAQMILANTYHLMLRPGAERIAKFGGVRQFMGWTGPILTDSGGYQVMSLAKLRKIDDGGVTFQSHIDGSKHYLSPERSIDIQYLLDATVTMAFDECTPYPATKDEVAESTQLSMRWAERSKVAFKPREGYALFGIVQGGIHADLRAESAAKLQAIGFDGYAIGGLAVGEGQELMFSTLDVTTPHLPTTHARYLMGVGKPLDIVGAVVRGMDMFDCVLPTRSGRTAQAFTSQGPLNMRNAKHADDPRPLDEAVNCPASRNYSRAYLHHLIRSEEILGLMLLSWHNVAFYQHLMAQLRDAIAAGILQNFIQQFTAAQAGGELNDDAAG